MGKNRQHRRAPYRYWSGAEEKEIVERIGQGQTLAVIALSLKRPQRAVREKIRRMGLKARKPDRGPCDCDRCGEQQECLQCILRYRPLPHPECERAWPTKPRC